MKIPLFLFFIFLTPLNLQAEPYYISLDELVTTSQAIFIGSYEGRMNQTSTHTVNIKEILKGNIHRGNNQLKQQQERFTPQLKIHENFIGFLDKEGYFLFAALPVNGSDLNGPLTVRGFYDFNAYMVSPSLITLDQLKKFIQGDKKLRYHFKGNIYFLKEGHSEIVSSSHQVEVDYTYGDDKTATVGGLNFIKGFQLKPTTRITSRERSPHVFLDYHLNYERPLELVGEVINYDKKEDVFITRFWPAKPTPLSEKQWEKYVQNDKLKKPYYEIKVSLNKETWKLWMFKEGEYSYYLDGFRQNKFAITEISLSSQRYLKIPLYGDGTLWIYMHPAKIEFKDYYGIDGFLQELFYGPIECEAVVENSKTPLPKTSCTMTLLPINYNSGRNSS